jgi:hypothetical protein
MMNTETFHVSACALITLSGTTLAHAEETPALLEPSIGQVHNAAHIYYNVVTGERVITLLDDQFSGAQADSFSSAPVWATRVQSACADHGYPTEYFFGVNSPPPTTEVSDLLAYSITLLDYGDIQHDTVVDCIEVNWVTTHPDDDLDGDGVGDGVEELAGEWIVWDAHNGRPECHALPMVHFLFTNLAGNINGPDSVTGYTLNVDLTASDNGPDLTFEMGNTDDDCQGAAVCVNDLDTNFDGIGDGANWSQVDFDFDSMPDSDMDGDGLFDFAWSVRFHQPGTGNDFDSDSDTGTLAPVSLRTIGVGMGFPEGSAIDNGDGTWSYNIDQFAALPGNGVEDRAVTYSAPNASGSMLYTGGFWFGGIACTGGLLDDGGSGYVPPAMFEFTLFTPNGATLCLVDLNGDGVLNFFDVSAFILDYQSGGDYNGDGMTSFFDISAFIADYTSNCGMG